jgi:hypothetical protein
MHTLAAASRSAECRSPTPGPKAMLRPTWPPISCRVLLPQPWFHLAVIHAASIHQSLRATPSPSAPQSASWTTSPHTSPGLNPLPPHAHVHPENTCTPTHASLHPTSAPAGSRTGAAPHPLGCRGPAHAVTQHAWPTLPRTHLGNIKVGGRHFARGGACMSGSSEPRIRRLITGRRPPTGPPPLPPHTALPPHYPQGGRARLHATGGCSGPPAAAHLRAGAAGGPRVMARGVTAWQWLRAAGAAPPTKLHTGI